MNTHLASVLTGFALVGAAGPAAGHHAFGAEYDVNKPVTVKGVVAKIEWTNPHARFYVEGTDEKGTTLTWNFELASVNSLTRNGWTRRTISVGDRVTVKAFLAKASADSGKANAVEVTLADGRRFSTDSSGDTPQ